MLIVSKDLKRLESFYFGDEYIKFFACCGKQLGSFSKVKPRTAIWPSNFNLCYILKRNKTCYHKGLNTNVHGSIIHNGKKSGSNSSVHQLMNR